MKDDEDVRDPVRPKEILTNHGEEQEDDVEVGAEVVEEEREDVMECGGCEEESGVRRPKMRRGPGEPSRAEIENTR